MSVQTLPTRSSRARPNVRHRVRLDGKDYLLDLDWNGREGAWYLHCSDATGVPVFAGRKIVSNARLGQRSVDPRRPAGRLVALDPSGVGDPGIDDLGARVMLAYIDAAGVAAFQGGA